MPSLLAFGHRLSCVVRIYFFMYCEWKHGSGNTCWNPVFPSRWYRWMVERSQRIARIPDMFSAPSGADTVFADCESTVN